MKIIGLTGGIASGKSQAANYFAELGAPIIDADAIAHQLVAKGMPALVQIQVVFGDDILDATGNLDRAKMRLLIFNNQLMKDKLEAILHPLIYQEIKKQIADLRKHQPPLPYCVVVIPLLAEKLSLFGDLLDHIIVVDAPETVQLERILARGGNKQTKHPKLSRTEALAIIQAQAKREERLAIANEIIDNSGDLIDLKEKVTRLHKIWNNV